MRKNILTICMILCLCLSLGMTAFATEDTSGENRTIPEERQLPRLVDEADILTDEEEADLLEKLDEISERQECDVALVTVDSLNGANVEDYADDFYDYNGYGMGSGDDGILFLISMGEREWAITTYGFGITAFTDAGLDYMEERFLPDLSDGTYEKAFSIYAELCDKFLTQAADGEPYDVDNLPKMPLSRSWIWKSLLIGAAIAFIITGCMRSRLKTVRKQMSATGYVKDGSMNLTDSRELYLYRRVTRHKIEKSSGSSGGSSTHTSSSGRSHGGSSGRF